MANKCAFKTTSFYREHLSGKRCEIVMKRRLYVDKQRLANILCVSAHSERGVRLFFRLSSSLSLSIFESVFHPERIPFENVRFFLFMSMVKIFVY